MPNHGSDLAAVGTRGFTGGDEIIITGQKVWASGAAKANRMFCCAGPIRTRDSPMCFQRAKSSELLLGDGSHRERLAARIGL
jgi:alkylation response protein AidB-like acyl-CoA dehydrogenase